jgi:hypothetical protein
MDRLHQPAFGLLLIVLAGCASSTVTEHRP